MRAALRTGTLLEQHELAALEVASGTIEHRDDLERKCDLAVEVLMQRVPVAGAVAQQQGSRAPLACAVAAAQERAQRARIADVLAQILRPAIRRRGQWWVESGAQRRDHLRQRLSEVLVLARTEA